METVKHEILRLPSAPTGLIAPGFDQGLEKIRDPLPSPGVSIVRLSVAQWSEEKRLSCEARGVLQGPQLEVAEDRYRADRVFVITSRKPHLTLRHLQCSNKRKSH